MLVLVGGPTGVGKTTLIEQLAAKGCRVVHTYTTRPARPGDRFKTSMTPEAYAAAAARMLWPAQFLYGAFYGEDYREVMAAACPRHRTTWLVDAAPETLDVFAFIPHFRLVLMPAEADFLARSLAAANRLERLEKSVEETARWRRLLATAGHGAAGPATVAVPCGWGQQAEILRLSRVALAAWRRGRGDAATP